MVNFVSQLSHRLTHSGSHEAAVPIDPDFITALKYHQLVSAVQEVLPLPQLKEWQFHNLKRTKIQLLAKQYLSDFFNHNAVKFKWLKGQGLAEKLYPTQASRYASDLDVLIQSRDAVLTCAVKLIAEGWTYSNNANKNTPNHLQQYLKLHKDIPLSHPTFGTLELHYRVTAIPTPLGTAYEAWLWQNNQQNLSAEEFLYLCYHGTTTAYHRLKWLYDIHLYITAWSNEIDINDLLTKAHNLDCERPLLLSWYLAHQIFQTSLPEIVQIKIQQSPLIRFAAKRVITHANQCSGRKPHTAYRLERRLFWYFAHKTRQHRYQIGRHLAILAWQRFK